MSDQSLLKIATDRALEVFENSAVADEWLQRPCTTLGGVAPLSLLVDRAGLNEVLRALAAIEYGLPP